MHIEKRTERFRRVIQPFAVRERGYHDSEPWYSGADPKQLRPIVNREDE